jgi:hypothetical protein
MKKERWSINIELVSGCSNTKCSSWGDVCAPKKLEFMDKSTLHKILSQISTKKDANICLFGLGDSLEHPHFNDMVRIIKDSGFENTQLNADINSLISHRSLLEKGEAFSTLVINHKKHIKSLHNLDLSFLCKYGKIGHVFLLKGIDENILLEIDKYIGQTINFHSDQRYFISPLWKHPFGKPPQIREKTFTVRDIDIPVEKINKDDTIRVYFKVNGMVGKCFFSEDIFNSIEEMLLNSQQECDTCNVNHITYRVHTIKGGDKHETQI